MKCADISYESAEQVRILYNDDINTTDTSIWLFCRCSHARRPYIRSAANFETLFSLPADPLARAPAACASFTAPITGGLRSRTVALTGVRGVIGVGAADEGIALTGVPTTVDVGLWKEGDSSMTDWKGGAFDAEASLGPGNDGEGMIPGAGKDGESTIMPGICVGRFPGAGNEGESTIIPGICAGRF